MFNVDVCSFYAAVAAILMRWCIVEFVVADIEDIQWSSSPLDCLTIPNEQKEVIIALAETRLDLLPSVPFDDFVAGKGRGLNVPLQ